MHRYHLLIEYVGTNFRGWQVQKKGKTIQGFVQQKISKLLKEKIVSIGCLRTIICLIPENISGCSDAIVNISSVM